MKFDVNIIREDFPGLNRKIGDKQLVYLDSAATSQTPKCVVDSIVDMYFNQKANVHRDGHRV